jgi:hypothetical protein
MTDLSQLWKHLESQLLLGPHSSHGPSHWRQVEQHGLMLARDSGADERAARGRW